MDIDLPDEDYWLLDDDTLILSVFSANGRIGGFARPEDPRLLGQCATVRDQVLERAIPTLATSPEDTGILDHIG
jgi:hypothetical protein